MPASRDECKQAWTHKSDICRWVAGPGQGEYTVEAARDVLEVSLLGLVEVKGRIRRRPWG